MSWSDTQVVVTIPSSATPMTVTMQLIADGALTDASTPNFSIVSPTSPLLQFSVADTPLQVNLTSPQNLDWIHWGRISATLPDRKAGITPLISDYIPINGAQPGMSFGNIAFSWTDGN